MAKHDYGPLEWKIKQIFDTKGDFCKALGVAPSTLISYLNDTTSWPGDIIEKACELLQIDNRDIGFYFYTLTVADMKQEASK